MLVQSLLDHRQYLRPRTRRILAGPTHQGEALDALSEAAADALADWDGTISDLPSSSTPGSVFGRAVLWCEDVDTVAETVDVRLLCRTRNEFPEQGLSIEIAGIEGLFRCDESRLGWSTDLRSREGRPFDASRLDWSAGARLQDPNTKWNFTLPKAAARLFVSAQAEHLSGFLETYTLLPNTPFFLLIREEHRGLVEAWGQNSCAAFKHVAIRSGLPTGWRAYSADGAASDAPVSAHLSVLSFPRTSRITPLAGLTASASSYFFFALPDILVTGVSQSSELFCNHVRVGVCNGAALQLPEEAAGARRLLLEARSGQQVLCRRSIYTDRAVAWPLNDVPFWRDEFGESTAVDSLTRISGAVVRSPSVPAFTDWLIRDPEPTPIESGDAADTHGDRPEIAPGQPAESVACTALSEADVRVLLTEWHRDVKGQRLDPFEGTLGARHLGTSLTEGCIQYVTACGPGGTARNFSRAISELTRATSSSDALVAVVAKALLQVARYRSGRSPEEVISGQALTAQFGRLRWFTALLSGQSCDTPSLDGIGIADISPLNEDADLERRVIGA
jgi:hypothetical protein